MGMVVARMIVIGVRLAVWLALMLVIVARVGFRFCFGRGLFFVLVFVIGVCLRFSIRVRRFLALVLVIVIRVLAFRLRLCGLGVISNQVKPFHVHEHGPVVGRAGRLENAHHLKLVFVDMAAFFSLGAVG